MSYFLQEMYQTIKLAQDFDNLKPLAEQQVEAIKELEGVTQHLLGLAGQGKIEEFLADSVLYIEMFGIITIAWQWLLQAICAQKALNSNTNLIESDELFYQGKIHP